MSGGGERSGNGRIIGIDFGTSHSAVAAIGGRGEPELIANLASGTSIPSVVSLVEGDDGRPDLLVGARAQRAAASSPQDSVSGFKRLLGRRLADGEVERLATTLPYRVIAAPNGDAWVEARGLALSPPELAALVLRELRIAAETHLGEPVREAVIAVPAHFDNEQRRAMRDAGEIAGLEVRRLVNEPTAAALGYGAHRGFDRRLAVCDLGAGSFDVSFVTVEHEVIEVISAASDPSLGGDDMDWVLLVHLLDEIRQAHGLEVASDPPSLQRLRDACRAAKHRLDRAGQADLALVLGIGAGAPLEYERCLRRDELEFWLESLVDALERPCLEAAARCGMRPSAADAVLLVGGGTRMPAVQRRLARIFGQSPRTMNQGEIVALGAATLGAVIDGRYDGVAVLDVTSRAIGVDLGDGKYQQVISRNTALPTREHKVATTTASGQQELELDVYEGESPEPSDNRLLGHFVCSGLPDAPGKVVVVFDFTVDVDGILRLSARELGDDHRLDLRLRATAGLTRARVRQLRDDFARL